ncbi:MAG: GNAT family N-acetyltransferase [Proteobacteria bacterium]|nr:GNAT family N-acetyltransferase [Pseudomonadota bacterium]
MPEGENQITVKVLTNISQVSAENWDACAGPGNPFVSHGFLNALETSDSVQASKGWQPQHLIIEDEAGKIAACAPLYLKGHSYGEYIFDWGWAEAYERAGGNYYPKLQAAVPFTPATGPRLIVHPDQPPETAKSLIAGMVQLANKLEVSSLHITFPTKEEWDLLGESGFLKRTSKQFHWENRGYETFEDFLGALSSRKRKAIKKERRQIVEQGIKLYALTGDDLKPHHWDRFYDFYIDTIDRKWGRPYLNREFFEILGDTLAHLAVLVFAEVDGQIIAGALNLRGSDTLFGRNWGCSSDYKFLHFEACYYQAIDFAIEHKLKWVEAGAQGPHKIQRGYLPRNVYSAHYIEDPNFRAAVARFVEQERENVDYEIAQLMEYSPYRNEGGE